MCLKEKKHAAAVEIDQQNSVEMNVLHKNRSSKSFNPGGRNIALQLISNIFITVSK